MKHVHIQLMGGIWRVSERNFRRLLVDMRADKDISLDNYGKCIITNWVDYKNLVDEMMEEENDQI